MVGLSSISWRLPAWATSSTDEVEDVDEPPEPECSRKNPQQFRRAPVQQPSEKTSLLTKAIMGSPDHEVHDGNRAIPDLNRRRSMASNVSIASTADLTSDTGLTSPARTNTPSPPPPSLAVSQLRTGPVPTKHISFVGHGSTAQTKQGAGLPSNTSSNDEGPRKRSIQFACNTRPTTSERPPPARAPSSQEAPRRPCIKFACQAKPTSQTTMARKATPPPSPQTRKSRSPSTPRKSSVTSAGMATPRPSSSHRKSSSGTKTSRPKFINAKPVELADDGSHFHEFACEKTRDDDWIRHDTSGAKCKLTINDTLTKENRIRRIAKEAEEEDELEAGSADDASDSQGEDEDDSGEENEDDGDDDASDVDSESDEDDLAEEEDDFDLSEGYHTDEETGFASSDDSDAEEDGNMVMWTLSKSPAIRPTPPIALARRPSLQDHPSDSSTTTGSPRARRSKRQRIKPQQPTVDLPDSTDFVCGTLDEDRPLEEAYLSCMAARRNEKLRVIPQDIDPSFPASDPEDEDEDLYNPVHHDSDDEEFLPGAMEDLHHDQDRSRRPRKSGAASPRKCHTPPPKRHVSPAPRARGRSPKLLFDVHSPRRIRSPAPRAMITPQGSPRLGNHVKFNLAARPGLTTTKSLPRPGAGFVKQFRNHPKLVQDDDIHVRGALDIVKGLEGKRQRRKEKFYQKYCNRARRGQIPERKPQKPGHGAERMKELGLLMAGKKDQGNYVLSI